MRKILLCLEDYNELLFVETFLKKLGFSVDSVRNEYALGDKLLAISPDLVIATGKGHKISGLRVSKRVKKKGVRAKLLLLFPREKMLSEEELDDFAADATLETPLNPRRVIASICQLTGLDLDPVMAKFEKLPIAKEVSQEGSGLQIIYSKDSSKHNQVTVAGAAKSSRAEKYKDFLKNVPPSTQTIFSRKAVQDEIKEIRKYEKNTDLSDLEDQRKTFVTALFKKK